MRYYMDHYWVHFVWIGLCVFIMISAGVKMDNEEMNFLVGKIRANHEVIVKLDAKFEQKIKDDNYKNALFDKLHAELVKYRNGESERATDSMAIEIIQICEVLENKVKSIKESERVIYMNTEMISALDSLIVQLGDILYRQGYERFLSDDNCVDTKKQKIVGFVKTENGELNNSVAEKLSAGYEKNNRIIYRERVRVFKQTRS